MMMNPVIVSHCLRKLGPFMREISARESYISLTPPARAYSIEIASDLDWLVPYEQH